MKALLKPTRAAALSIEAGMAIFWIVRKRPTIDIALARRFSSGGHSFVWGAVINEIAGRKPRFCGGFCGRLFGPASYVFEKIGRSERIRTSDPLVPNEVRYQAALHSDIAILRRHCLTSRRARGRAFASAPLYSFPAWRLQHMFP